ncbi:peptidoglycan DD-metalloendopeptidase family protein [Pontibacter silvestris]|uniref:Peptidoglycan DD-metalloendopeptidase family protein n=1 Tax=Pontibacter silvestris TaxID=2305183 RepID=A0ABW4WWG6_9BACT|nr:M23 family metallopeptidase [Pontibacter silvestris]MCC9138375.1 M23 family metallopeptidase [Pontibacter silvestris]
MHKQNIKLVQLTIYSCILLLLASCGKQQTLRRVFKKETPYQQYLSSLKSAKLDHTELGRSWIEAGQDALQDSLTVTLPFKETGYIAAEEPKAASYRFKAERGQKVVVNLETRSRNEGKVFMDMFEVLATQGKEPKLVAYTDTASNTIEYEIDDELMHLLRIQPELLQSVQYTITIKSQPVLAFPVLGKSSRNIASIWGDPRDAGARRHEGIDIFATRGTPAIASVAGYVSRVQETPRGGKVVWLSDTKHHQSLYYAHLDKQLVQAGQHVNIGDTLGLIGNTGNAITTNPHLHFGIYRYGQGATNPYPYVHEPSQTPSTIKSDLSTLGGWVRISPKLANVRLMPTTKSNVYMSLPQHTPLQVLGGTSNWYRVQLPNKVEAYVSASVVENISQPVRYESLAKQTDLLDEAHPLAAAKDSLSAGTSVAVLASFNDYRLVRNNDGETGWIYTGQQASLSAGR